MRRRLITSCVCLCAGLFAQSDRGTITGTIADPAGAVVPNAPVEVRNTDTGAVYQVAASATGNYVVELPAATYELSVAASGFKKYVRQNLVLPVAQTLRIDVTLEIGSSAESVTVTEAAPLLKTESGELSHNVATGTLNNLPVLGIGSSAGAAGIRNPYAVLEVLPGADWQPDLSIRLNGMPSNSQALRIEGQDSTNGIASSTQSQTQPSIDAIEEFAIQTSNYSAEFGQAGGGVFNITMRSGTNQFHGSGYDYFVNEDLNAGVPFTDSGNGHLLRPRQRRNDYGFTLGGPVEIPKLYNGHNKTFFFFNFEQFRETTITNNKPLTVPTLAYRNGNFTQALTNRNLGSDPLGRPILENTIYDPSSDTVINGLRERNPFPNNTVPLSQIDPVALNILKYVPLPTSNTLLNNFLPVYANQRVTSIPSVKIDHSISATLKLSGYWSRTSNTNPNNDGLPYPITTAIPTTTIANTVRINLDYTLKPTLLLHVGAGVLYATQKTVASFDPSTIGFKGANTNLFPLISTLPSGGLTAGPPAQGGLSPIGTGSVANLQNPKPTATVSLTWVRDNHTFKFGGETVFEGYLANLRSYAASWMYFGFPETGLPSLNGVNLNGGNVGFPFASFLMGRVDSGYFSVPSTVRLGSHAYSAYAQDSWKITRRLTLDYGLRYDFEVYLKEHNGLMPNASLSTPNPSAGNYPGGLIFEGYGPGRCNCAFAHNYPFAFGPRLGFAFQITPKTVLRAGSGLSYGRQNSLNGKTNNAGSSNPYGSPSYGDPAFLMQNGVPYHVTFPNFDPGQLPLPGTIGNPTNLIDQNAGRPARILQWSVGLQRELTRNVLVEATYIGNRGVWWQANTMRAVNALTQQRLSMFGLSFNNPDDLKLLASPLNSPLAAARGFNNPPYPSFPVTATVMQSLRLMPEYTNPVNTWPPLGDTWYNALQAKATKRFSHGLEATYSFTWSKQEVIGSEQDYNYFGFIAPATNDVYNRRNNKYLSGYDQPFLSVIAATYTTPKLKASGLLKLPSVAARDWQIGAVLRYGSGLPIQVPQATTNLTTYTGQSTFVDRVSGVPLFTQDLNCHCFDPNKTFVLNPAAWVNPPVGQFGTAAAYYSDYRYQRRPVENMSLARNIRFKERFNLQIRAEFTNIFNRTEPNNPTATNAFATQTRSLNGNTAGGFGSIITNTTTGAVTFAGPRQGTLVARFQF
ncbi:MAG: carboxypeptidase regulatory-like domain-containing protein [Acidobacteriia bacterium]|nr:carboxypeptidase regulatory-like domain-containing protein [Terriglobia bacterium]